MRSRKHSILCISISFLLLFSGCGKAPQTKTPAAAKTTEDVLPSQASDTSTPEPTDTLQKEEGSAKTDTPAPRTPTPTETGTPPPEEATIEPVTPIDQYLDSLTIEEKVAQMFIVLPEALTGTDLVTEAGDTTREAIGRTPVGGLVYMEQNLQTPSQVSEMLQNAQSYSMDRIGLPLFTCIDEEGGSVARLNGNPAFDLPYIGDMAEIGSLGNVDQAYNIGLEMGSYLSDLGFNVDFAPVADVLTDPANEVVRSRSFGSDPSLVSDMASAVSRGLREKNVCSTFKHFPGHGATEGDTHAGYAYTLKSLEELEDSELIPFQQGIDEDVDLIMVGHISLPNIIGDDTPASLSYKMITEILRERMGYDGLVITDALNMGAVSQTYSSADAAVRSIQSGTDLILMPADFQEAYQGVLNAVNDQMISTDRIDASMRRILQVKSRFM